MNRKLRSVVSYVLALAVACLSLVSCGQSEEKEDAVVDRDALLMLGDSIAMLAQKTLLQNVSGAIAKGGADYAVDFCNLRALPLTDSIGKAGGVSIQRVTDRARNSANKISGEREIALFEQVRDSLANGKTATHYLLDGLEKGTMVYYKPIMVGMPACLQCHGAPGADIAMATLDKIKEKYPDDEATGYSLGALRGMWKITMPL